MSDLPHELLITGATGFIGRALVARLGADRRYVVRAAVRGSAGSLSGNVRTVVMPELGPTGDWRVAVERVRTVIHAAGCAHRMERANDPSHEYFRINVEGTLRLARAAAAAGAQRFIFLSSIKVHGEVNRPGQPFHADDLPAPVDPYAVSKYEAERGLAGVAAETGMEIVTLRPPLVYGPGVKANFLKLMRWLHRGWPLPLASVRNRRTLVALDNLVDLIVTCIDHPAAGNQLFLAGDPEDLSTGELARRLARALGTSARLIPVPQSSITMITRFLGMEAAGTRLCGSLQVDTGKTRSLLNWEPPVDVDTALSATAARFLAEERK